MKENWTEKHRNVARMIFLERRLDEEETIRHRMVGQALPLSGMAHRKAGYSGMFQELGAKGENVEERMEMAKRHSRAPSQ